MIHSFELTKGKSFVAGLAWHPISSTGRDAKKEAADLGADQDYDLAVWRHTETTQVGFGSTEEGAVPGQYSLAAIISKSVEVDYGARTFLCAMELPTGKWLYVQQFNGVIASNGDFVGSEKEVEMRLKQARSTMGHVDIIFAPGYWGSDNEFKECTLDTFLPKKNGKVVYKSWWQLNPIKGKSHRRLLVMIVILAIAAGAVFGYKKWQDKRRQEALALLLAQQQSQVEKLPHPWKSEPRAKDLVAGCLSAYQSLPNLYMGNWKIKSINCGGGSFTIIWGKGEHALIEHILAVEPRAIVSPDGTTASLSYPVTVQSGEDEAVPEERQRVLALRILGERHALPLGLQPAADPPRLPGEKPGQPQAVRDWREIQWKVQPTPFAPDVVVGTLDGNGFRIKNISATAEDGGLRWSMEGIQYVQQ